MRVDRAWVRRKPAADEAGRREGGAEAPPKLRIMSYNILANRLAEEHYYDLYRAVPIKYMEWQYRLEGIVREVRRLKPDILCLQEVDAFDDLERELRGTGYCGTFIGRNGHAEGCATFWKFQAFECLASESIDFSRHNLRNNVALVHVLRVKGLHDHKLVLGNIHVLFNPKRGDIKLAQIRTLFDVVASARKAHACHSAVICGDFNSVPDSPLYSFISLGKLDCSACDRKYLSGQVEGLSCGIESFLGRSKPNSLAKMDDAATNPQATARKQKTSNHWSQENLRIALGSDGCEQPSSNPGPIGSSSSSSSVATHPLRLVSSYKTVSSMEPAYTSAHRRFVGTVDYIWYDVGEDGDGNTASLSPVGVLLPPSMHDLARENEYCLPSKRWPSDHISVVTDFAIREAK